MAVVVGALGGEVGRVIFRVGGKRLHALAEGEWYRTLGVCDLTLPARASEPWTLPMLAFDLGFYLSSESSVVAQRSQSLPEGGVVRNFAGESDGQRFRCVGEMARVMAKTYLLFDGFDVAVRDWRCRSKPPSPKFAGPHTPRSWHGLRHSHAVHVTCMQ